MISQRLFHRRSLGLLGVLVWLALVAAPVRSPLADVPIPDGYRLDHYRAPTPASVPGADRVYAEQVRDLIARDAVVLIDVMGATLHDTDDGSQWTIKGGRHDGIPGSVWLANFGVGALPSRLETHYRSRIAALADPGKPLLVYCKADCWMSWNAAKRLGEWGYDNVLWFAEGVDGWRGTDQTLVSLEPEPVP